MCFKRNSWLELRTVNPTPPTKSLVLPACRRAAASLFGRSVRPLPRGALPPVQPAGRAVRERRVRCATSCCTSLPPSIGSAPSLAGNPAHLSATDLLAVPPPLPAAFEANAYLASLPGLACLHVMPADGIEEDANREGTVVSRHAIPLPGTCADFVLQQVRAFCYGSYLMVLQQT